MDLAFALIERYFPSPASELLIGGVPVSSLAERYGTPLFVYDTGVLEKKWDLLRSALCQLPERGQAVAPAPLLLARLLQVLLGRGVLVDRHRLGAGGLGCRQRDVGLDDLHAADDRAAADERRHKRYQDQELSHEQGALIMKHEKEVAAIAKGAGLEHVSRVETVMEFGEAVLAAFARNDLSVIVAKVSAVGPNHYGMDLHLPENAFRFRRWISGRRSRPDSGTSSS